MDSLRWWYLFSEDNGVNFLRRNVGIQGTDFWGYGQGWWQGDVMLGGAYHNGTMLREESVYINNWLCTDGGDQWVLSIPVLTGKPTVNTILNN
ncbi:MAG: hypothetical protein IPK25_17940 [Saprospiraceae bacterium]|nr:hypothetical protein [Saprospiraceae bacterium]